MLHLTWYIIDTIANGVLGRKVKGCALDRCNLAGGDLDLVDRRVVLPERIGL